ncbi:TPA: replisome organizer [Streptococcus equi subsp. zooepidemicus]|nr:replisome organizer [Streptococcus equi subsp. zooepidemicus]HEL1229790.1 replisome organizer [Streptococcus equi subsp. zooepidemicus]
MAERRMLSKSVIQSDRFLEMPLSSQALYMHLNICADDDGFVGNPKTIIRMIGASEDDFKLLFAKGFIIIFETGIIVISHWKRNNYIQKDRYKETMYKSEKSFLKISSTNVYEKTDTVCIQNGYKSDTQVRVGKDRIDKVSIDKGRIVPDTPILYGEYKNVRLTDEEYQKLKDKLQAHTDTMIEKLSRYIKSAGKDYQDHYVTILNWYEQDKDKLTQKSKKNILTWEEYDKGEHL